MDEDRLLLHKMSATYPDMNFGMYEPVLSRVLYFPNIATWIPYLFHYFINYFITGELDCDTWEQLCISLQVEEAPAWAVLKSGGAYQRLQSADEIRSAAEAVRLHSLSTSELLRILEGG